MPHRPPVCPSWCETHSDPDIGWDADEAKLCSTTITVGADVDGQPVTVSIDRPAYLGDDGHRVVETPTVTPYCVGALTPAAAMRYAETLMYAQAIIERTPEPRPVEAAA